ncbi:hypothetical protein ABZS66_20725 [Dactylosporangium sp. NPDC005572]|uniref:YqeB family protein n=1 Tax=Dactylosporangium sp. NPDC005572 TaxID=3156889 RepID=UPI0033BF419B
MPNDNSTTLRFSAIDRFVVNVGVPAFFVAVGAVLPVLARWMLSWDTALPLKPVVRVVGAIDNPWKIAVNLAIWLVIGVVVAVASYRDAAVVTLTDDEARMTLGDATTTVPRADVAAAFADGARLVLLDDRSRELFRERTQTSKGALAAAFRAHGYPWQDADPYAELFRAWVPGSPDLPPEADQVLSARAGALRHKAADEARDLRKVAESMGYVVRDAGKEQQWRPLVHS